MSVYVKSHIRNRSKKSKNSKKKRKLNILGYLYYNELLPVNWEDELEIEYDIYGEYKAIVNGKEIDSWEVYNIADYFSRKFNYQYDDLDADDYSITLYNENGEIVDEIYVEDFIKAEINKRLKPVYRRV
ncbi:MAG: hypothetical protein ACTSYD_02430 [Candidatus Heimdallarchaeaceae archaeon]